MGFGSGWYVTPVSGACPSPLVLPNFKPSLCTVSRVTISNFSFLDMQTYSLAVDTSRLTQQDCHKAAGIEHQPLHNLQADVRVHDANGDAAISCRGHG